VIHARLSARMEVLCRCVCMYMCVYVYIRVYAYVCTCVYYIYMYMCVCVFWRNVRIHTYIYTYIHTYIHIYIHTCTQGGCSSCACPSGFSGMACENGYNVSTTALCANPKEQTVTVTYNFGSNADAPTQRSFVGIFKTNEKRALQVCMCVYVCMYDCHCGIQLRQQC
jgi:hypothetical protein